MELSRRIADWIKKQVDGSGKKGVVVGLSGGIDSSVTAALAKMALGDNVLGLMLPCKSDARDKEYAAGLAAKFNIKTKEMSLDKAYDDLIKMQPDADKMAKANVKPRLRMTALYYFAGTLDYLVAGTDNKSEIVTGYFTKYGDGGTDILPLGGLLKTKVLELAKELGIPDEIIKRPPSAGLWEKQTDENEMGITYEELDKIIIAIEKNDTKTVDKNKLEKLKKMIAGSEHKRKPIPTFQN